MPIELDEADLLAKEPDKDGLKEIFMELEFRQLMDRIFRNLPQEPKPTDTSNKTDSQPDLFSQLDESNETIPIPSDKKDINLVEHQYHLLDTAKKINDLLIHDNLFRKK